MRVIADKYEVRGVLGEGGTGIVYDAVRTADGASVALKVMHEALAGDKQIRGRFQREAAILRRLEGPHVCTILDFGETPGETPETSLLYIAMPKIEGESLEKVLARGPLPVDRALDVLREVLEALASAHKQGVIHRDLKPANVLLDKDGKVIVGDFGMSKIVTGTGTGTTNLTAHNMLFGTPEYMSPEQARGDELDARCDVYAAGVMLYELIACEAPFTGTTPLGVLTAHLTGDLVPPSKRAGAKDRITPALEAVTLHALARDPNLRYTSATALSAAIQHARQAPDDVHAVRPSAFSNAPTGTDAFAATIPATSAPPVDPNAATLLGDSEIPKAALPSRPSPPITSPSPRVSSRPSPEPASNKAWIALWVVVVVLSIAAGSWLALRS
ncbi:MAG: serine/threonine protein kinase [Labilithrix sp.]|nr:serine/threonine protein kinase [Labilithrix sp.]MCW5810163.1 serine/threonine protein kinase [Labilithrix sp.]